MWAGEGFVVGNSVAELLHVSARDTMSAQKAGGSRESGVVACSWREVLHKPFNRLLYHKTLATTGMG